MIQCRCKVFNCFFVVNYHAPITLQQVQDSPPFQGMELLKDEHDHIWDIQVIKFGREK